MVETVAAVAAAVVRKGKCFVEKDLGIAEFAEKDSGTAETGLGIVGFAETDLGIVGFAETDLGSEKATIAAAAAVVVAPKRRGRTTLWSPRLR